MPHQACAGMAGLGATLGFAGSLSPPPGTSPGRGSQPGGAHSGQLSIPREVVPGSCQHASPRHLVSGGVPCLPGPLSQAESLPTGPASLAY